MSGNLRDKLPILKKFAEHFLSKDSFGCIKFSEKYQSFIKEARFTGTGRPSGGFTVIIKDNLTSKLFEQHESFIAMEVCGLVLVCVYFPTSCKNEKSKRKFNLSFGKLAYMRVENKAVGS